MGIDPDPKAVASAHKSGLSVNQGGLPRTGLQYRQFDAVTLSHVIEHVHDPVVALREVHRILKPGGRVWMATPNMDSTSHRMFHRHWLHLDLPRHLVIFNASSLKLACEHGGFINAVLQRLPSGTALCFLASLRIMQGQGPTKVNKGDLLPWKLKWRARWTDLRATLMPELGEELFVIATKPQEG